MKKWALVFSLLGICQMAKAQNNIALDYIIYPHPLFPDIAIVDAEIVNNTDRDIYFLTQSCNHLDYYLSSTHKGADVYILMNCNVSSPEKVKLSAHGKHSFASHVSFQKGASQAALRLELIQLDANTSLKGKTISEVEESYKHQSLYLQGPLVTQDKQNDID